MTEHQRQLLILFKALAEALKHVPNRKLEITISEFELRRDLVAEGPDSLRLLKSTSPDGFTTHYRFMRLQDYEAMMREGERQPGRKLYLD